MEHVDIYPYVCSQDVDIRGSIVISITPLSHDPEQRSQKMYAYTLPVVDRVERVTELHLLFNYQLPEYLVYKI